MGNPRVRVARARPEPSAVSENRTPSFPAACMAHSHVNTATARRCAVLVEQHAGLPTRHAALHPCMSSIHHDQVIASSGYHE